ncbi:hypothetical protein W823_12425 [Williamsia sp. D3]|nr:hypothetical protein W823_12425 [Williamsia sp. D3]
MKVALSDGAAASVPDARRLCLLSLIGCARQRPGEDRLGDAGGGDAQIESGLHGPAAGALLTRRIDDDVDEWLACLGIHLAEDLGGDLDEVAVEVSRVPLAEDVGDLCDREVQGLAHQVVGLADELHVGVLDAVVDHFHEVSGTVGADVGAAGLPVDVGRDRLEQRAEGLVGLGRSARHDRRSVERTLFAAGDTRADEVQATLGHRGFAADGVRVERIAAVDDDVAFLHLGGELLDYRIGRGAGFHHDQDTTGLLERRDEFGDCLGSHEVSLVAVLFDQCVGLRDTAVVQCDGVAVTGEVSGDVGAHHRQAGDTDLGAGSCFSHAYTL